MDYAVYICSRWENYHTLLYIKIFLSEILIQEILVDERKILMSENKWDVFASTGKISDYLNYRGITVGIHGENNADGNKNDNPQGTGNTGISCG